MRLFLCLEIVGWRGLAPGEFYQLIVGGIEQVIGVRTLIPAVHDKLAPIVGSADDGFFVTGDGLGYRVKMLLSNGADEMSYRRLWLIPGYSWAS